MSAPSAWDGTAQWRKRQIMAYQSQNSSPQATDVGERLRVLRKQERLTQAELARQIGIQQSDLSRMEKGEYRVSLDNLFKILGVLDVEISDFFGREARQAEATSRPLTQEDMQTLHLLKCVFTALVVDLSRSPSR